MTSTSDGKHRDHTRDTEPSTSLEDTGQDLHPAIDPREPPAAADDAPLHEAPPLDVDERAESSGDHDVPDVIELSEHIDVDEQPAIEESPTSDESGEPPAIDPDDEHEPDPASEPEPDSEPLHEESSAAPEPFTRNAREKPLAKASTMIAGVASRIGLGKLLDTTEDTVGGQPRDPGQSFPPGRSKTGIAGAMARAGDGVREYIDPRLHMFSTIPHRRLMAAAAVIVLLCLLANSGGLALIALSSIVPILILITLTQHDVFEKESNLLIALVCAAGAVVGIVLSTLASWVHASRWFDEGVLNFGAAGFGGRFADAAGPAPWPVWLLVGLVIPAVSIAGFAGIPIAMRRWPQFRNEVMDGVILTGASAAGFSIGASLVYWWPMIADTGPQTNVSDWTLSTLGVALLRPIVVTLCGAMIGAGIWRYMIATHASALVLPATGGVVGYLLLTFGSIQLQPSGNWPEFLWTLLVVAAVFVLYRRVLDQAVATDRLALGTDNKRIVCPACHKVTPVGAFCSICGHPLSNQDS